MMMIAFVNVVQTYIATLCENRFIHWRSLFSYLTLCSTENASVFALNYYFLPMRSLPCRLHCGWNWGRAGGYKRENGGPSLDALDVSTDLVDCTSQMKEKRESKPFGMLSICCLPPLLFTLVVHTNRQNSQTKSVPTTTTTGYIYDAYSQEKKKDFFCFFPLRNTLSVWPSLFLSLSLS